MDNIFDFDLDMEFVPNMDLYNDDSDDDLVAEKIITDKITNTKTKNKTEKHITEECEICENPNTVHIKYKADGYMREFDFCKECKTYVNLIIENKLMAILTELNIKVPCKRTISFMIRCIIRNADDGLLACNKINEILDESIEKYKNDTKNNTVYDNIKILDYDNNFCCFTTRKRMNKFVKEGVVNVLGDKLIKWNYPKVKNRESIFQVTEDRMKENKCFTCGRTEFIKSISIFPDKKNLSIFLKDHILIHFFFAFCSKCRDECTKNRDICNDYYKDILHKSCDEYIEDLYKDGESDKIMEFVSNYINKFKEITKGN